MNHLGFIPRHKKHSWPTIDPLVKKGFRTHKSQKPEKKPMSYNAMAAPAGVLFANTATTTASKFYVPTFYQTNVYTNSMAQIGAGTAAPIQHQVGLEDFDDNTLKYVLERRGYRILKELTHAIPRAIDYLRVNEGHLAPAPVRTLRGFALPEKNGTYVMPDGSSIVTDMYGNYRIEDRESKVVYKANRIREFNRYVNASDLLEAFIKEVGEIDSVDQGEVLRLPIEAFINWIILGAAKQDGDSTANLPTVEAALPRPLALPNPKSVAPRCGACGRYIRRAWAAAQIAFCSPEHMALKLAQLTDTMLLSSVNS